MRIVIRFTSQLSVVDYYRPSVIFFVHVHMKQEQGRKSEERIVLLLVFSDQWRIRFPLMLLSVSTLRCVQ
jgi:hypothetical protein